MRFIRSFYLVFLFSFLCQVVFALPIPAKPDGYVTDSAGILSAQVEEQLNQALALFERETSNQIVIATFGSLDGESLEDFSIRLAQQWKVGQKDRDNGVILLVFRDDRRLRIDVGYGLESVLPDAICGQIIRNVIAPSFKRGDYEQGIIEGVRSMMNATKGVYQGLDVSKKTHQVDWGWVILLALILMIDVTRYGFYEMSHNKYASRYGFIEWWIYFSIFFFLLKILLSRGAGGGSSDYGGHSRGYGSGGFSGGGGRFGGGGSSGGW